ncbi:MAG: hypothetical protein K2X48_13820 [Chitinophagaceae bacterium]|nr:hypothetical protein [Chitinophagaceae bacterium]
MKDKMERFFYNPVSKEYEFKLRSDLFESDLKYINENKIDNILLTTETYKWSSIEALLEIQNLRTLHLGIGAVELTNLYKLNGIKVLSIGEECFNVNLEGLESLEKLYISYRKGLKGLNSLINLEDLEFRECRDKKFDWKNEFSGLKKLKHLELTLCALPATFGFLDQNKNLETLEIHYCRSEFSIKILSTLPNLSKLILAQCPNIKDIENVEMLQSLKWLRITDAGVIKDCSFISKMKNLEVLIVNGKSYFENGDLSSAIGKLKHFGFDNKKHYSHKEEDFPSVFR